MPRKPAPKKVDRSKSMRQLTGRAWRGDNLAAQLFVGLDDESEAAWKKPLTKLTVADLFLLISQRASLGKEVGYLLPLAVEQVEKDPLVSGNSFPGELHTALALLDGEVWSEHPDLAARWAVTFVAASERRKTLSSTHRDILNSMIELARLQHPWVEAAFNLSKKKTKPSKQNRKPQK